MLTTNIKAPEFKFKNQKEKEHNFPKDFAGKWCVLFFLRHLGCPLCQEKISELKKSYQKYLDENAEVFVVVEATEKRVKTFAQKKEINFQLIPDKEKKFYRAYQVGAGGIKEFLAPIVFKATLRATLKGHFHGRFEGSEFQKPACFIIDPKGNLVYAKYGKNIADVIGEKELFDKLEELKEKKNE